MPVVNYITHDGRELAVDADAGSSLMQIAMDKLVPGILGDCGGSGSCGTCHVYVDEQWVDRVPAASEDETIMLEGVLNPQSCGRLSCQLHLRPELSGIILYIPRTQI